MGERERLREHEGCLLSHCSNHKDQDNTAHLDALYTLYSCYVYAFTVIYILKKAHTYIIHRYTKYIDARMPTTNKILILLFGQYWNPTWLQTSRTRDWFSYFFTLHEFLQKGMLTASVYATKKHWNTFIKNFPLQSILIVAVMQMVLDRPIYSFFFFFISSKSFRLTCLKWCTLTSDLKLQ